MNDLSVLTRTRNILEKIIKRETERELIHEVESEKGRAQYIADLELALKQVNQRLESA